jgi:hypothetical protein
MSAMVVSKAVELKMGRNHSLSNIFKVGDESIHRIIDSLVFLYNRYRMISRIFFFEFLPSYAYELLTRLKDKVSQKYYSYSTGDGFRGRRVLRSNGSVSFFLERLSEDESRAES